MLRPLKQIPPQSYLDMLQLINSSKFVMTDSGGIQEETTIINIPCLTLRNNTERPITLTQGTSVLVGNDQEKIVTEAKSILSNGGKKASTPDLWDGQAAERIINTLNKYL